MSDDIDIEEHDVLDNPIIKEIFPDISKLKKEIEEGELLTNPFIKTTVENEHEEKYSQRIIFDESQTVDSLVQEIKTRKQNLTLESEVISKLDNCQTQFQQFQNKIVIGSKPNSVSLNRGTLNDERKKPTVVLEDVSIFLKNNNKYCKNCRKLFNKKKDLDNHINIAHNVMHDDKETEADKTQGFKCDVCNIAYSTKSNLNKHFNKIHKKKDNTFPETVLSRTRNKSKTRKSEVYINKKDNTAFPETVSRTRNRSKTQKSEVNLKKKDNTAFPKTVLSRTRNRRKTQKSEVNLKKEDGVSETVLSRTRNRIKTQESEVNLKEESEFSCSHCSEVFLNQKSLIEHLYSVLEPNKNNATTSIKLTYQEKCDIVDNSLISKKIYDDSIEHETISENISMSFSNEKSLDDDDDQMLIDGQNEDIQDNGQIDSETLTSNGNLKTDVEKSTFTHNNNEHNCGIENIQNNKQIKPISRKNPDMWLFRCPICSYYMKEKKTYLAHLVKNHRVKQTSLAKRVLFDPVCKICSNDYSFNTIRSYNNHVRNHTQEYTKVITDITTKGNRVEANESDELKSTNNIPFAEFQSVLRTFALKSFLFKCCKCDIHFFSADDAMRHTDHIEILVNWRCPICQLLFKKQGEQLHMKQHNSSKNFTIFDVSENSINIYLYNCSKCTVYFEELRYLYHYPLCGSSPPDSEYCKVCDILIDKTTMEYHTSLHKNKKMKPSQFTLVDSADILEDTTTTKKKRKRRRLTNEDVIYEKGWMQIMLLLSYCETCKSYVTNVARRRKAHIESRCRNITKYACKRCGIVLTQRALHTHKKLHKLKKNLTLRDFKFFDLNNKLQINPPIPEYPQCGICKVYFLSKNAVKSHTCSDEEYLICKKCDIKLSQCAYKMHMSFHNYTTDKKDGKKKRKLPSTSMQDKGDSTKMKLIKTTENLTEFSKAKNVAGGACTIIYSCKICFLSCCDYDEVVEHCQDHFIRKTVTNISKCDQCSLSFRKESYDTHRKTCSFSSSYKHSFKIVNFDTYYFEAETKVWVKHTLESLSPEQVEMIISKSIYQFEHRTKMTVTQQGECNIRVYMCDRCWCFIDPISIKDHIEDECSKSKKKFPCVVCGLGFESTFSKEKHEKIHEGKNISLKALKIITFNRNDDKLYNKILTDTRELHVLYQCRNCKAAIEKSHRETHLCRRDNLEHCDKCGLIIEEDYFIKHLTNHANLTNFNDGYMKVVLFGEGNVKNDLNIQLCSSYVGLICDYTLFKCLHCNVCVDDERLISDHICLPSRPPYTCSECEVYFLTYIIHQKHFKQHKNDSEFIRENINFIQFNCSSSKNLSKSEYNEDSKNIIEINSKSDTIIDPTDNIENVQIYRCKCKLHFIREAAARKHSISCNPKAKISKQNCSKCDLMFTPTELFNHLMSHHAKKGILFKYEFKDV